MAPDLYEMVLRTFQIWAQDYNKNKSLIFKFSTFSDFILGFIVQWFLTAISLTAPAAKPAADKPDLIEVTLITWRHTFMPKVFDVGNEEADLYLTPNPYDFEFFNSHFAPSSTPAPLPTPSQAANQQANQN